MSVSNNTVHKFNDQFPLRTIITSGGILHHANATVESVLDGLNLPYHVIFSAGLADYWKASGWMRDSGELVEESSWWDMSAPLIEDVWNYYSTKKISAPGREKAMAAQLNKRFVVSAKKLTDFMRNREANAYQRREYSLIPKDISQGIIASCLQAGVRSLDQGIRAAIDFLYQRECLNLLDICESITGIRLSLHDIDNVNLHHVKEGHTSSILRVSVGTDIGRADIVFCLNVARDTSSSAVELQQNYHDLENWYGKAPNKTIAVYAFGHGAYQGFGQMHKISVMAVEWVDNSRELHVIRNEKNHDHGTFFAVEEFNQIDSAIPSMTGVRLSENDSDKTWGDIIINLTQFADFDWNSNVVTAAEIEINDGDVVYDGPGEEPSIYFISSSLERWQGPIGAWPYKMALISARDAYSDGHQRIYWGNIEKSIQSLDEKGIGKKILQAALAINKQDALQSISGREISSSAWALINQIDIHIKSALNKYI